MVIIIMVMLEMMIMVTDEKENNSCHCSGILVSLLDQSSRDSDGDREYCRSSKRHFKNNVTIVMMMMTTEDLTRVMTQVLNS